MLIPCNISSLFFAGKIFATNDHICVSPLFNPLYDMDMNIRLILHIHQAIIIAHIYNLIVMNRTPGIRSLSLMIRAKLTCHRMSLKFSLKYKKVDDTHILTMEGQHDFDKLSSQICCGRHKRPRKASLHKKQSYQRSMKQTD